MKKIISLAICLLLILVHFGFNALAASNNESQKTQISLSNVSGNPGDTVYVPVKLSNNSGYSNAAFSIEYDRSALKYVDICTSIISDFTLYDHSAKGRITIASTDTREISDDGTLICYKFKIKKSAKAKTYKLKLSKVFFSNSKDKKLKLSIKGSTLEVKDSCKSGEHKYFGWTPAISKTCTSDGIKTRYCSVCGHANNKTVKAEGHKLEGAYTLDTEAKGDMPGMLSRHCTVCGAKTHAVIYTKDNDAALSINNILEKLGENTADNLAYFLNGEITYPDIYGDDFDPAEYYVNSKNTVNEDNTINVDVLIDKLARRFFGENKKSGIFGAIKRASIAGEFSLKTLFKLFHIAVF